MTDVNVDRDIDFEKPLMWVGERCLLLWSKNVVSKIDGQFGAAVEPRVLSFPLLISLQPSGDRCS